MPDATTAGAPAAPAGPPDLAAIARRYLDGHVSGAEGREHQLATGVMQVITTIGDRVPYPHEMNDALVKVWLLSIQFAKDRGLLAEFVQKDIDSMRPINARLARLIAETGEHEIALQGVAGYSTCHFQLYPQTWREPGSRTFKSPFTTVLEAARSVGQFDLTEREIHEDWFVPRMHGFATDLGVRFTVTPWSDDGMITLRLAG